MCGFDPCDLYDEWLIGYGWRKLRFPSVVCHGTLQRKKRVVEAAWVNYDEQGRLLETDRLTKAKRLLSALEELEREKQ